MEPIGQMQTIDLSALAQAVTDQYTNIVVSTMNDYCLHLAVMTEEYQWHRHPTSDELFLVLEGELLIDFKDRESVVLTPNCIFTVAAGVAHRTRALQRTVNLCVEQRMASTEFLDG